MPTGAGLTYEDFQGRDMSEVMNEVDKQRANAMHNARSNMTEKERKAEEEANTDHYGPISIKHGPEHETAHEMARRLKRERKEAKARKKEQKDMPAILKGAVQGYAAAMAMSQSSAKQYGSQTQLDRSEMVGEPAPKSAEPQAQAAAQKPEPHVKSHEQPARSSEPEQPDAGASLTHDVGGPRDPNTTPAGRKLPDISHIQSRVKAPELEYAGKYE